MLKSVFTPLSPLQGAPASQDAPVLFVDASPNPSLALELQSRQDAGSKAWPLPEHHAASQLASAASAPAALAPAATPPAVTAGLYTANRHQANALPVPGKSC